MMKAAKDNKWYNLFVGLLWGITGKDEGEFASLMKCLPANWQAVDPVAVPEETKKADQNETSVWMTIIEGVGKVIDFVCQWKDKIKDQFVKKDRLLMRRQRMMMRTHLKRYTWSFGEWWKQVKEEATQILKEVKSWVAAKWEQVKKFGREIVDNLVIFWEHTKAKVKAFINSPFVQTVLQIKTCITGAKDLVKALVDMVKGVIDKVKAIGLIAAGDMTELAKLVVDLICNYNDFVDAFKSLYNGIIEPNSLKKFGHFGRFLGRLAKAIIVA